MLVTTENYPQLPNTYMQQTVYLPCQRQSFPWHHSDRQLREGSDLQDRLGYAVSHTRSESIQLQFPGKFEQTE